MFYKNSQNCKVQSSRLHWRNHRSTEQSLQAEFEGGCIGPLGSLLINPHVGPLEFLSCTIRDLSRAASVLL